MAEIEDFPGLARRIAFAVEKAGGQGKAAAAVGASRAAIQKWRTENARPPLLEIFLLSKAAGVSVDWIVTGFEAPAKGEANTAHAGDFITLPMRSVVRGELVTAPNEDWPFVPFRRDYLEHYGADPEACFVMMVTDNDVPGIVPTTLAVVDGAARDLGADGLYAFIRRQRLMILGVRAKLDGGVVLSKGSDTEELAALDTAKLSVLGRVRIVCAPVA